MTGRPILREKIAGSAMIVVPEILEPKPPPQYSATSVISSASTSSARARANFVCCVLWVETKACRRPFSQYAMLERGSMGWCVTDWWTTASSMITSAAANPASTSPFDQVERASGSGMRPASIASKSAAVHLNSDQPSWPEKTLPPV